MISLNHKHSILLLYHILILKVYNHKFIRDSKTHFIYENRMSLFIFFDLFSYKLHIKCNFVGKKYKFGIRIKYYIIPMRIIIVEKKNFMNYS